MLPNTRWTVDRRSVIKGAGAGLALVASPAAGPGGARGPSRRAHVEILSDTVQETPAGAAITVEAVLPEGGFIVVYDNDDENSEFVGATDPALGRGVYPRMMVRVLADRLEKGENYLTAALYRDSNDDRHFGDGDQPYEDATDTATVTY